MKYKITNLNVKRNIVSRKIKCKGERKIIFIEM